MKKEKNCLVKRMRSGMFQAVLFVAMAALSGCGVGNSSTDSQSPESTVVQPANNKLAIGKTQQFTLVSSYSGDVSSSVVWSSSSPSVATITPAGMASALAAGQTTIKASKGEVTYTTTLIVPVATVQFNNISGAQVSPAGIWDGTYTIYDAVDANEIGTYKFKLDLGLSGTSVTGTSALRYDNALRKSVGTFTEGQLSNGKINFIFTYIDPRVSHEMVNIGTAMISGTTMVGEVLENYNNGWNCSYRFTVNKQ